MKPLSEEPYGSKSIFSRLWTYCVQGLSKVWLGSDNSAVNTYRFWIYLLFLVTALCLICLLRALKAQ